MEGELHTTSDVTAHALAVAAESFAATLDRLSPFAIDASLRSEIVTESTTVLDAFARAADPVGVREAMALVGLLGRRAAELGSSAVELAAISEALLDAVGESLSSRDRQSLRGLLIEGYTRGLLEHDREQELDARIRATRPFVLAPRCVALVLQGRGDPDWIAGATEGLGPLLLGADARAVVVVVHLDGDIADGAIAELASMVDVAGVVGARVIFVGASSAAAPLRSRLGERASIVTDDVAAAVSEAISLANASPAEAVRARVAGLLKRLGV
ncbi:MAG: hypothetical protein K1X94_02535 [Sandaracinaceae bacterium]|nr:hypothetical protein [Sandaracinaceae bacterium]